ncbi:5577_t:CDS:1 [Funneliformis geosporum]|nr:5577_t:CDS:1 [Funneliformis geosporum]
MKLLELKTKIQDLINEAVNINNQQKTLLNFLFSKLEEVKELETLEQLKEYKNGIYLKAYLFYQSIKRANYQPEHLKLTKLDNIEKCLEVIEKDIEANQPKEQKPKEKELTNEQLLTLLSERIIGNEYENNPIQKS